ncbi:MAG: Flp pilus assembly complex ATPase component TadA [Planctomycetaceae bacterium]|jgi:general secretion pathway protein E|nr:Flp pilus assembly complex ATPase component TadA [Planctomycetaceae bacterium]MBT4013682.1 Flp pilus assembly complex ATPase component TadA [Planctomycetaceae bacterium]MBT4725436.1 Flp pilus assembly complex ATPase component TadA [Planctomycetaceae bacterium]MBT4846961.1 Flp pilus assembly complex ATPase component TadA [Planctomycetaceae bacterium]MBT5123193.1 Flp pilus assembly complex ATPase component TadA [Planctomycetaceae bacterium]
MQACEILQNHNLLNETQVETILQSGVSGTDQIDMAVELGYLEQAVALQAIGDSIGVGYVDLRTADIDLALLEDFPTRLIYREQVFPIAVEGGQILIATSDPFDMYAVDEVAAAIGKAVLPVLAASPEIDSLIKQHLGVGSETIDSLIQQRQDDVELLEEIEGDGSELSEMAQEASVIRLVNEILLEAIQMRASDVHIESQTNGVTIRYRIDGMLHPQPVPPEINQFQAAIISRLKIMAHLNIAEKRLPQDGRIKLKVKGREIDIRVSVIPMIHGEGIVMRILDKGSMVFDLQSLGMEPAIYEQFKQLITLPHGIVLVCGPTGSGKTTTLYSSLMEIKNPANKIITTEDPVEYQLDGINQIQVHSRIGLTFSTTLRSILRHDPDIVLVGEIRDVETAENAIQASLTGHMVFSTLHTNDSAGAYTRMTDMGVEPFLVASTVEAVMSQRLVRRLCNDCKSPVKLTAKDLPPDFPIDLLDGQDLFEAVGCRECRNVGYSGRMGVYELMITTDAIRELATERASSWQLKKSAVEGGMTTLRDDSWRKVLSGTTSVDEVLRITKGDQIVGKS